MTEINYIYKIFVYGSLKSGFRNHRLLQESNAEFLGTKYTKDTNFLMFSLGSYPAVVKNEKFGYGAIEGELYLIDDNTLFKLDLLESNGSFYKREEIELNDGSKAWMYLTNKSYQHMTDDDNQIEMAYCDDKIVFIWRQASFFKYSRNYLLK